MSELRKATAEDFDFTYNAKKAGLRSYIEEVYGPWNEEWQLAEYKKDFITGHIEIVMSGGKPAGYIYLRRTATAIYLMDICLLPEFHGRGIGTSIIKTVLAESKAKGAYVELGVFKINTAAMRLYERLGFNVVSETDTHIIMRG